MLGRSNGNSTGLADYIVEAGVDSATGYTYRKWNSGFAEAWVTNGLRYYKYY